MNQIGIAIKKIRVTSNETQERLSKKLGISRSYLCELECGRKKTSMKTLDKMAEHWNTKLSQIIYLSENLNEVMPEWFTPIIKEASILNESKNRNYP